MAVNWHVQPDGTIDVSTDDADPYLAERRAKYHREIDDAILRVRASGDPRPVVLFVPRQWPAFPGLEAAGPSPEMRSFVLARREARGVMRRLGVRNSRDLFRQADWPSST